MTRDADIARIAAVLNEVRVHHPAPQAAAALYDAGLRPSVEPAGDGARLANEQAICLSCAHERREHSSGAMCQGVTVRFRSAGASSEGCGCAWFPDNPDFVTSFPEAIDALCKAWDRGWPVTREVAALRALAALLPTQASDSPEKP